MRLRARDGGDDRAALLPRHRESDAGELVEGVLDVAKRDRSPRCAHEGCERRIEPVVAVFVAMEDVGADVLVAPLEHAHEARLAAERFDELPMRVAHRRPTFEIDAHEVDRRAPGERAANAPGFLPSALAKTTRMVVLA